MIFNNNYKFTNIILNELEGRIVVFRPENFSWIVSIFVIVLEKLKEGF